MERVDDDRSLFERLVLLRGLYARRGDRDRQGAFSIADMIRHVELVMSRPAQPLASA